MVRGHRVDAGLVDRGVFFDGKFSVSCAGGEYQLLLDQTVVFNVWVYDCDSDVAIVSLQIFSFVRQDRVGNVVYFFVMGEVCGYDIE